MLPQPKLARIHRQSPSSSSPSVFSLSLTCRRFRGRGLLLVLFGFLSYLLFSFSKTLLELGEPLAHRPHHRGKPWTENQESDCQDHQPLESTRQLKHIISLYTPFSLPSTLRTTPKGKEPIQRLRKHYTALSHTTPHFSKATHRLTTLPFDGPERKPRQAPVPDSH